MTTHLLRYGFTWIGCSLVAGICIVSAQTNDVSKNEMTGIHEMLKGYSSNTWVFIGDSVTQGAKHTAGWRSYPEHFAERVRYELKRKQDAVINMGVSSSRTEKPLREYETQVKRFHPDVVFIMYGINDAGAGPKGRELFRGNLRKLVDRVRADGAIPILNTPNLICPGVSPTDLPAYAEVIREVAREKDVILIDHYRHWQELRQDRSEVLEWLADGKVHPNVYGHREIANEIFRALGVFDTNSPTCSLPVLP